MQKEEGHREIKEMEKKEVARIRLRRLIVKMSKNILKR
jgi:hypothetical protein